MGRRKLSKTETAEMVRDFLDRDEDTETPDDIAERHGVSRSTLYLWVKKHLDAEAEVSVGHAGEGRLPPEVDGFGGGGEDWASIIKWFATELMEAKAEIAVLERRLEQQTPPPA